MKYLETKIVGAWVLNPITHTDNRGLFFEQWRESEFTAITGRAFIPRQLSQSVSKKGVVRGIHFTRGSKGQAKLVSCLQGSVWDVVIDLRPNSKTYGCWVAEFLSSENRKSVFIAEGLGHAFLSLENNSIVSYLGDAEYDAALDGCVDSFDETLNIPFLAVAKDFSIMELHRSEKDQTAPAFQAK